MNEKIYDFNGIIEYQSEVEAIIKSELLVMTNEANFTQTNIDSLNKELIALQKELASAQSGYQNALGLTEEENGSELRSIYLNKINEVSSKIPVITSRINKLNDSLTRLNKGILELETSWEEARNFLNNVTTAMKVFDGNFTKFTDSLEEEINNFTRNIRNIKRAFIDNNARWYGGSPIFDVDFSISTEDILDNKLNMIDKFKSSVHEFNNEMFGYDIETGKVNLEGSKLAGLSEEEIKGLGGKLAEGTKKNSIITDQISLDRLLLLHPNYRTLFEEAYKEMLEIHPDLRISQGYRSFDEQNKYYNQGRSLPGIVVTNAKAGESYHNYGLAFDIVRIVDEEANYDIDFEKLAEIGNKYSLEWGGRWISFPDNPHFQYTNGYSISDLQKKYVDGGVDDYGYPVME